MRKKTALFVLFMFLILSMATIASATIFSSEYIDRCHASINIQTNGDLNLRFSISACNYMDKLGAQTIILQERIDSNSSWHEAKTYSYEQYPEMLTTNASTYNSKVTYSDAITGYEYRIKVYFYAEKGGYDTDEYITNPIKF